MPTWDHMIMYIVNYRPIDYLLWNIIKFEI